MSSSASLANFILNNMSYRMSDSTAVSAAAASTAPAFLVPQPEQLEQPEVNTSCGGDPRFSDHSYCCGCDDGDDGDEYVREDDEAPEPFSNSGVISKQERLRANFNVFGLDMDHVISMMRDTTMVIGGGFMVNHILAMNELEKPLCPSSDIDFYVYGGIPPIFTGSPLDRKNWNRHNSERMHATAFRSMVIQRFGELIASAGYGFACGDDDYSCEITEAGDRVFTTGSNIRMQVLTYKAKINGQTKKLNLVFSDANMYDFITKVDISLTAGFLCASSGYKTFDYHHAAPQDVIEHTLKWMEPESTHTPRQKARMTKYRTRYDMEELLKMTTSEFIRDYDTLPDENIHIELQGTEDEIHSKPVVRRVLGMMPSVKFSVAMTSTSVLGDLTVYSNFPTTSDRIEYARQMARSSASMPSLVMYDDDTE